MDRGKRNTSKRHNGSSLALLESLAYESSDDYSTKNSSLHSHSSSHSQKPSEVHSQCKSKESGLCYKDKIQRSCQERYGSEKWGWESRLREAEEDLRQLRRRSKSATSIRKPLSEAVDWSFTEHLQESTSKTRTRRAELKTSGKDAPGATEDHVASKVADESEGESVVSGLERMPGFGDRWASSVLLEELMSLKKELKRTKDREAELAKQLEETERDKDNICRLWEEDRAKMLGLKLAVENTFATANEQLRDRLSHRNTD